MISFAGKLMGLTALVAAAAVGSGRAADVGSVRGAVTLPQGLESYLEARVLEANGRYREAIEAYGQAVLEAPEVDEVRLAYASFLIDVGMADRAVEVLEGREDIGPEGLRVRALALAQLATRRPEQTPDAETALRAAVEAGDTDPNLQFALAQVLQQQGKLEEAEQVISALRENRPDNPRLVEMNADLLQALGRDQEASELYRGCIGDGPTAASCRTKLVDLLVELERPAEAGELMLGWLRDEDLDSLMRAAVLLWEGGRLELSLETVQRVLARAPDSPRALNLEAHLLSMLGRHAEAMDRLKKLLRKAPDDIDLMLAMAWSVGRSGDQDEARAWLDRGWQSVAGNPQSRDAIRCALTGARLELLAGNAISAGEWLDRVGDIGAAGSDYLRLLAEMYRRQEDWAGGVAAMVRAAPQLEGRARLEAEAIEAEFRLRLGDQRAWLRMRPLLDSTRLADVLLGLQVLQTVERWPDVEREAAAAAERFPDSRELLFARAAASERVGKIEPAEELFLRLVESDPEDADAANYLGYMWADRGENLDHALELIRRAVSSEPENVAFLDSLGWVHYRRGELEEAERWLRRAIELGGDVGDGTILCHLGEVLMAKTAHDEGRRYLQLGLDMGCDDPDHVRSLLDRARDGRQ
jgi:tetratricopeptide (TPR) repeat protein